MTTIRTASASTYGQLVVGQDIWVGRKHGIVSEIISSVSEIIPGGTILEIIVEHQDEEVVLTGTSTTTTMRRATR